MGNGLAASVDVLRERDLLPGGLRAVMLVGSTARGWSNSRSDYDLYLVSEQPWTSETSGTIKVPLTPPLVRTESFYADARRWEVTYWLDTQVDQMLAKVSWDEFARDQVAGEVLVVREELFLERLATCVPLHGADWVARRQGELERSAYRSFVVARSLGEADDAVEDTLGQLEAGDVESAVISARIALGHAIDALLEQHGQFGRQPKWRMRRFRAANPSMLSIGDFWNLYTMRGFDPADPAKWVHEVLMLCQDISMKVEV